MGFYDTVAGALVNNSTGHELREACIDFIRSKYRKPGANINELIQLRVEDLNSLPLPLSQEDTAELNKLNDLLLLKSPLTPEESYKIVSQYCDMLRSNRKSPEKSEIFFLHQYLQDTKKCNLEVVSETASPTKLASGKYLHSGIKNPNYPTLYINVEKNHVLSTPPSLYDQKRALRIVDFLATPNTDSEGFQTKMLDGTEYRSWESGRPFSPGHYLYLASAEKVYQNNIEYIHDNLDKCSNTDQKFNFIVKTLDKKDIDTQTYWAPWLSLPGWQDDSNLTFIDELSREMTNAGDSRTTEELKAVVVKEFSDAINKEYTNRTKKYEKFNNVSLLQTQINHYIRSDETYKKLIFEDDLSEITSDILKYIRGRNLGSEFNVRDDLLKEAINNNIWHTQKTLSEMLEEDVYAYLHASSPPLGDTKIFVEKKEELTSIIKKRYTELLTETPNKKTLEEAKDYIDKNANKIAVLVDKVKNKAKNKLDAIPVNPPDFSDSECALIGKFIGRFTHAELAKDLNTCLKVFREEHLSISDSDYEKNVGDLKYNALTKIFKSVAHTDSLLGNYLSNLTREELTAIRDSFKSSATLSGSDPKLQKCFTILSKAFGKEYEGYFSIVPATKSLDKNFVDVLDRHKKAIADKCDAVITERNKNNISRYCEILPVKTLQKLSQARDEKECARILASSQVTPDKLYDEKGVKLTDSATKLVTGAKNISSCINKTITAVNAVVNAATDTAANLQANEARAKADEARDQMNDLLSSTFSSSSSSIINDILKKLDAFTTEASDAASAADKVAKAKTAHQAAKEARQTAESDTNDHDAVSKAKKDIDISEITDAESRAQTAKNEHDDVVKKYNAAKEAFQTITVVNSTLSDESKVTGIINSLVDTHPDQIYNCIKAVFAANSVSDIRQAITELNNIVGLRAADANVPRATLAIEFARDVASAVEKTSEPAAVDKILELIRSIHDTLNECEPTRPEKKVTTIKALMTTSTPPGSSALELSVQILESTKEEVLKYTAAQTITKEIQNITDLTSEAAQAVKEAALTADKLKNLAAGIISDKTEKNEINDTTARVNELAKKVDDAVKKIFQEILKVQLANHSSRLKLNSDIKAKHDNATTVMNACKKAVANIRIAVADANKLANASYTSIEKEKELDTEAVKAKKLADKLEAVDEAIKALIDANTVDNSVNNFKNTYIFNKKTTLGGTSLAPGLTSARVKEAADTELKFRKDVYLDKFIPYAADGTHFLADALDKRNSLYSHSPLTPADWKKLYQAKDESEVRKQLNHMKLLVTIPPSAMNIFRNSEAENLFQEVIKRRQALSSYDRIKNPALATLLKRWYPTINLDADKEHPVWKKIDFLNQELEKPVEEKKLIDCLTECLITKLAIPVNIAKKFTQDLENDKEAKAQLLLHHQRYLNSLKDHNAYHTLKKDVEKDRKIAEADLEKNIELEKKEFYEKWVGNTKEALKQIPNQVKTKREKGPEAKIIQNSFMKERFLDFLENKNTDGILSDIDHIETIMRKWLEIQAKTNMNDAPSVDRASKEFNAYMMDQSFMSPNDFKIIAEGHTLETAFVDKRLDVHIAKLREGINSDKFGKYKPGTLFSSASIDSSILQPLSKKEMEHLQTGIWRTNKINDFLNYAGSTGEYLGTGTLGLASLGATAAGGVGIASLSGTIGAGTFAAVAIIPIALVGIGAVATLYGSYLLFKHARNQYKATEWKDSTIKSPIGNFDDLLDMLIKITDYSEGTLNKPDIFKDMKKFIAIDLQYFNEIIKVFHEERALLDELKTQIEALKTAHGSEVKNHPEFNALVSEIDVREKRLDAQNDHYELFTKWAVKLEMVNTNLDEILGHKNKLIKEISYDPRFPKPQVHNKADWEQKRLYGGGTYRYIDSPVGGASIFKITRSGLSKSDVTSTLMEDISENQVCTTMYSVARDKNPGTPGPKIYDSGIVSTREYTKKGSLSFTAEWISEMESAEYSTPGTPGSTTMITHTLDFTKLDPGDRPPIMYDPTTGEYKIALGKKASEAETCKPEDYSTTLQNVKLGMAFNEGSLSQEIETRLFEVALTQLSECIIGHLDEREDWPNEKSPIKISINSPIGGYYVKEACKIIQKNYPALANSAFKFEGATPATSGNFNLTEKNIETVVQTQLDKMERSSKKVDDLKKFKSSINPNNPESQAAFLTAASTKKKNNLFGRFKRPISEEPPVSSSKLSRN